MTRSVAVIGAGVLLASLVLAGPVGAQDASPSPAVEAPSPGVQVGGDQPHPAHIHSGSCAELGDVVEPLEDVIPVTPVTADTERSHSSVTRVQMSLRQIRREPHAINVHESAENIGDYIACADLTGRPRDGLLVVALQEQNASGYSGVAFLEQGGDRTRVYLALTAPESEGDAVASPSPSPAATAEAAPSPVAASPGAASPAGSPAATAGQQVAIRDFTFQPDTLEIQAGTTVTWTNEDTSQHTATADDGSFDSGVLAQGDSFSHTFQEAGTFGYICSVHPNMTGTITVS